MATTLSAGIAVYDLLMADDTVRQSVSKVFPVIIRDDEGDVSLPYICFNRERVDHQPTKARVGSETATMVVAVYWDADHYTELARLCESVRAALDYKTYESEEDGIVMRSCLFSDSREYGDEEGHIVEELVFTIKI